MVEFTTNIEVIPGSKDDVHNYFKVMVKKINLLFLKYDIRDDKNKIEKLFLHDLMVMQHFSKEPRIKELSFLNRKQRFLPQEIILFFRDFVSESPMHIKTVLFDNFLNFLRERDDDKLLSDYIKSQCGFSFDGLLVLDAIELYSINSMVYRITFKKPLLSNKKYIFFLKETNKLRSSNEILYSSLQRRFLYSSRFANIPFLLRENEGNLLFSSSAPGVSSDIIFTKLIQARKNVAIPNDMITIDEALKVLLEAFISHAALGDLLGRNDRHLINSNIAFIEDDAIKTDVLNYFSSATDVLTWADNVAVNKMDSFSLVQFDIEWLLEEKNIEWMLLDIDFGLSELNLLSFFDEFNVYDDGDGVFYEKRKELIEYFYHIYIQTQSVIVKNKNFIFSEIKKYFSKQIVCEKIQFIEKNIFYFSNKETIISFFSRYLLDYRIRKIYQGSLNGLYQNAIDANNQEILSNLSHANLLQYIPARFGCDTLNQSASIELQCFRGVTYQWGEVMCRIENILKSFSPTLLSSLQNKKEFIKNDADKLLQGIV